MFTLDKRYIGYGYVQYLIYKNKECIDYFNYDGMNTYNLEHFLKHYNIDFKSNYEQPLIKELSKFKVFQ